MGASIAENDVDDDSDFAESHEINVTPFIDVMLVLLIIFMVAAPLATVDVNVDLPGSSAAAQPRPEKPLFLTLKRDLFNRLADICGTKAILASNTSSLPVTAIAAGVSGPARTT